MPSNEYRGMPKVCRLYTTAGGEPIDLLNPSGICIVEPPGWIPQISQLKGGGVRIGSQSLDDNTLVAGGYGPVSETFPLSVDAHYTAARVQELLKRLWEAEQFWLEGWQQNAIYLMVQLTEDSDLRYTRIKTGSFQIGVFAFGEREGLPNNTLVLEREPAWSSVIPGEMIGPFRNMAKNPSFERWNEHGIVDQIPTGWDEQIDANFPANPELEREESQIAGPSYALKMEYTGAGGGVPNEWYIHQRVRLLVDQNYTIKVWVHVTMGGGVGEEFFIRVYNSARTVLHLNETWDADVTGWQYLTFDTDREWYYYLLEIGFTAPATSIGSTAIVDRIFLTEGIWNEDNWPSDFYMSSTIVWGYFNPTCYDIVDTLGYAVDRQSSINIDGIPGDFDALARIALEMEQKEGFESGSEVMATANKIAIFGEKDVSETNLLYLNTPGYETGAELQIGNAATSYSLPEDILRAVFSRQYNGDEVTWLLNHSFRIFARINTDKSGYMQVGYWVGDPTQEILLDIQNIAAPSAPLAASDYELYLITPQKNVNWRSFAGERNPASVGLTIYAENTEGAGTATLKLDAIWIIPVDNGGCWSTSIVATGQALTLDSSSLTKPVQRAYNIIRTAFDDPLLGSGLRAIPHCIREYNGKLYAFYERVASEEYVFDGSFWTASMTYTGNDVMDTEVFDGFLWLVTNGGDIYYYDSNTDTATLLFTLAGTPVINYIQKYGPYLYVAHGTSVDRINGGVGNVINTAPEDAICLACYKHMLWAGCTSGVTETYTVAGGQVAGPVLPCGDDIVWMIEFQDRLYIACIDGDVYYWDGDVLTLSRTGTPANDDIAHQLEVFNNELYLLTGGPTQNVACLFKTSNGITWEEVFGLEGIETLRDTSCMEVFAGRLCCIIDKLNKSQWGCVWHAPLLATIDIPEHTGAAITLIPKETTRIHILYESYYDGFFVNIDTGNGAQAAKVWILPRWRALRSD